VEVGSCLYRLRLGLGGIADTVPVAEIKSSSAASEVLSNLITRPPLAIANTRATIPIPRHLQQALSFTPALVVVIGTDCKDIRPENVLDFIAGYTAAIDFGSQRNSSSNISRSFDQCLPTGPCIVSTRLLRETSGLRVKVSVNGEGRGEGRTKDEVMNVVSELSRGTTLQAGSLVTLTVEVSTKHSRPLEDGDEVAVDIVGIGKCVSTVYFD